MEAGRKQKSFKNVITGLFSKITVLIFAFVCRTVFIRLLGAEYTGVNGLFTNILSVLALAELGIGNVFSYSLYKHLAENNEDSVCELVNTFKRVYCFIGVTIFVIGIALIPFLPFVVKSALPLNEVILYYFLYLMDSVASYFFVYKTTVLNADQKQYINNIGTTVSQCAMYLMQIIYLLIVKDFVGFLLIQVLCTVGKNTIISRIADRYYPYLNNHRVKTKSLLKLNELKELWTNIKATFVYKICYTSIANTDNILISMILGTVVVGYYSNYFMLMQYIRAYVYILSSGLHASVGNYQVKGDYKSSYKLFNMLNLLYAAIGCIAVCVFLGCIQQFVPIWVGKEFVLGIDSVIAILSVLYIDIILSPVGLYRETLGFFKQVQYIMVPAAIINIVLSIILGISVGLSGIIIATAISKLLTVFWYEPKVLYTYFKVRLSSYFVVQFKYLIMTCMSSILTVLICSCMKDSLLWVFIRGIIAVAVSITVVFVFNISNPAYKELKTMLFPNSIINKEKANG